MPRAAWLLNLDAEEELAAPRRWRRSPRLWAATAAARARAFAQLAAPGDLLLEPGERAPSGSVGRAWCPTPSALHELERAGTAPPAAPPLEVLRRVNDRRFLLELGLALRAGRLIEDAQAYPREAAPLRHKTLLGAAGRGQRVFRPDRPSPADETWLAARLAQGPLWVEPELDLRAEFVVHGLVEPDGRVLVGPALHQRTSARGAWERTGPGPTDLPQAEARDAAARAGAGLANAGYFGPFGLDGFVHAHGVHPASDLNARFTMGWRVPPGGSVGTDG